MPGFEADEAGQRTSGNEKMCISDGCQELWNAE
jgi:hypothetical protein